MSLFDWTDPTNTSVERTPDTSTSHGRQVLDEATYRAVGVQMTFHIRLPTARLCTYLN